MASLLLTVYPQPAHFLAPGRGSLSLRSLLPFAVLSAQEASYIERRGQNPAFGTYTSRLDP